MPLVSIAVASYNHGKFIGALIQSVLDQTFSDFELIICDDRSTDNSRVVIESFQDIRIKKCFNDKNLGVVANINKAISLTRGKYVVVIGSDDLMFPDNLKRKVEVLEKNPHVGLIYSDFVDIDEEGNSTGRRRARNPSHDAVYAKEDFFVRLMEESNFIASPSVVVRKECYSRLGLYDERLRAAQDYEMWLRISLHYDCAYLSDSLVQYRWHSTNVTHDYLNENRQAGSAQESLCKEIAMESYHAFKKDFLSNVSLAKIYEDIGRFYLWSNDTQKARGYLWKALACRFFHPVLWKLFFMSLLSKNTLVSSKKLKGKKAVNNIGKIFSNCFTRAK